MNQKSFSVHRFALPGLLGIVLLLVLGACGDTATPVPTTTKAASTTAAATTAAATTAAATTAVPTKAATTAATTAVATTAAATTVAVTTTAATTAAATGATINFAKVFAITDSVDFNLEYLSAISKRLPGNNGFSVQVLASDKSLENLANTADTALTEAGYKAILTDKQTNYVLAGYTGPGTDYVVRTFSISSDVAELGKALDLPDLKPEMLQDLATKMKGKQSGIFILSGTGLLKGLGADSSTTTTPVAAVTTPATAGAIVLPTVKGLTEIKPNDEFLALVNKSLAGGSLKLYTSSDDAKTTAASIDSVYQAAGFAKDTSSTTTSTVPNSVTLSYTAGTAIVFGLAAPVPANSSTLETALNLPGLSPAALQALYDQLKNSKTFVFILSLS